MKSHFYYFTTRISQLHKLWQCLLEEYLQNKLERINSQQKHALRIIFNKSKFEHISELFKSSKILNIYKLNIFNTQFVIFRLLSYCFQETIGFDVKVSFASRPLSRLIS